MQIPADTIDSMLPVLRSCTRFQLPATNRPHRYVWNALDQCLHGLRLPLYNQRLGKKPATPKNRDEAIQQALTLLGAFGIAVGTKQAIISSSGGRVRSISFQPRPYGMQWNADYAIDPVALTHLSPLEPGCATVEDMLFLAAKVVHAISGYNMHQIPDLTATIRFLPSLGGVTVTIHEIPSGKRTFAEGFF